MMKPTFTDSRVYSKKSSRCTTRQLLKAQRANSRRSFGKEGDDPVRVNVIELEAHDTKCKKQDAEACKQNLGSYMQQLFKTLIVI